MKRIGCFATVVGLVALAFGCPGGGTDDGSTGSGSGSSDSEATSTSGSASGSASMSGSGSASGSASTTATGSASGETSSDTSSACDPPQHENPTYICCDATWIDPRSDPFNCGGCGTACEGDTPFCDQGTCGTPACSVRSCMPDETCCGAECCGSDSICCTLNGPIETGPGCVPLNTTASCPAGCAPLCRCAAPETPIATPTGDRPIATLVPGDLVYSVDDGQITVVPISDVQRVRAHDHTVVRAVLEDGRVLRVSPGHPLADGRTFGGLSVGQRLGDGALVEVDVVAYDEAFTHDILPLSSTGAYFVAGELVASTMRP